jgi:hypothetical protein
MGSRTEDTCTSRRHPGRRRNVYRHWNDRSDCNHRPGHLDATPPLTADRWQDAEGSHRDRVTTGRPAAEGGAGRRLRKVVDKARRSHGLSPSYLPNEHGARPRSPRTHGDPVGAEPPAVHWTMTVGRHQPLNWSIARSRAALPDQARPLAAGSARCWRIVPRRAAPAVIFQCCTAIRVVLTARCAP